MEYIMICINLQSYNHVWWLLVNILKDSLFNCGESYLVKTYRSNIFFSISCQFKVYCL